MENRKNKGIESYMGDKDLCLSHFGYTSISQGRLVSMFSPVTKPGTTVRVGVGIQLALNFQDLFRGCADDEIHNDSMADQRFATSVWANE